MPRFVPYAFLAFAVFAAYSNIYDNVFLFDDDLLIRLNTYLRGGWDHFLHLFTASTTEGAHIAGGFYRPMQNILYFIIFQLTGEQPFGFHLLNVGLHAANACLGYRLALRLGLDARAAILGMLLWALHPLHTEAVTYMSGTADPLFVCFCLGGLNVALPQLTQRSVMKSVPFFLLSLLSKETAVVFPALLVVCGWLVKVQDDQQELSSQRKSGSSASDSEPKTFGCADARRWIPTCVGMTPQEIGATLPLWIITVVFLAWRVSSPDFDGPERYRQLFQMPEYASLKLYAVDPFVRFSTFLATLPAYANLLVWPVDLHMERAFPLHLNLTTVPAVTGLVMLVAALAHILWSMKTRRGLALSWGLLWFMAAHAPNSGIFFYMNSLFLEHWMYLPTIGLFLGLAQTAVVLLDRFGKTWLGYASFGVTFIAIVALSARTYDQNNVWRDPVTFYTHIFSYGVVSPRAHNNLATAYMDRHETQKAIEEYHRAIKEGDTYAETHYNLALALLGLPDQREEMPEAIAQLERSVEIEPRFYRSYETLAQIYAYLGDNVKADAYRAKARQILGP